MSRLWGVNEFGVLKLDNAAHEMGAAVFWYWSYCDEIKLAVGIKATWHRKRVSFHFAPLRSIAYNRKLQYIDASIGRVSFVRLELSPWNFGMYLAVLMVACVARHYI